MSSGIKSNFYTVLMQINNGLGSMVSGFLLTMIGTAFPHLSLQYGWSQEVSLQQMILLINLYNIGSAVGCWTSGIFISRGRKMSLMVFDIVIIGTSFMSITNSEGMLFGGRFIAGIAYGLQTSVFPVYNFEMSPGETIGRGGAIVQISFCVGSLLPSFFGSFLPEPGNPAAPGIMKMILFAPGIIAAIQFVLLLLVFPQRTPGFLASQNLMKECKQSLSYMYAKQRVKKTLFEFKEQAKMVQANIGIGDLVSTYKYPFFLMLFGTFAFNATGGITLQIFAVMIFTKDGLVDLKQAIFLTNLLFLFLILGTTVCIFISDKVGRKDIMVKSYGAIAFLLGLLALVASAEQDITTLYVKVALIYAMQFIYGIYSSVFFTVAAEYVPVQAMGILVFFVMLGITVFATVFPLIVFSGVQEFGAYYIMSACTIISFIVYVNLFIECQNQGHQNLWRQLKVPFEDGKKKQKIQSSSKAKKKLKMFAKNDEVETGVYNRQRNGQKPSSSSKSDSYQTSESQPQQQSESQSQQQSESQSYQNSDST